MDVIFLGPGRSGTTTVYRYLKQDERYNLSDEKELDLFQTKCLKFELNNDKYVNSFAKNNKIKVELSPFYFINVDLIAPLIEDSFPSARVVVIVRDPFSRAYSQYKLLKNKVFFNDISFEEYLKVCENKFIKQDRTDINYCLFFENNYVEKILLLREVFGEKLHLLNFDLLTSNTLAFINEVNLISGLTPAVESKEVIVENKTVDVNNLLLHKIAIISGRKFEVLLNKFPKLKDFIKNIYFSINEKNSKEDLDSERRLYESFHMRLIPQTPLQVERIIKDAN